MTRSLRRSVTVCLLGLVAGTLPAATTQGAGAAPANPASSHDASVRSAYQGTDRRGYLSVGLKNTSSGKIRVTWKTATATKRIQRWEVRTSTSRTMHQHTRVYRRHARTRSIVVPHASLVTPASGASTFVKLAMVRKKRFGQVGQSPTKWIKAPVTVVPTGAARAVLGSFNVRSWNVEKSKADRFSWANRQARVYSTINRSGAGVIAIQEASGSAGAGYGGPRERQYTQMETRLGQLYPAADWQFTNEGPLRSSTAKGSGRQGTRVLFKRSEYELLDHGEWNVRGVRPPADDCWTSWARLRQRSTGIAFTFFSTHLATGDDPKRSKNGKFTRARVRQTKSILNRVAGFRAAHPTEQVFLAGDLNSTIYTPPDNVVHRLLIRSGWYDAFASRDITLGQYPTTNHLRFPVDAEPIRRDYILSKGPLTGSYWYHNLAYTSARNAASDHFMQVADMPIG